MIQKNVKTSRWF